MVVAKIGGVPLELDDEQVSKLVKMFVKELVSASLDMYSDEDTMNKIFETTMKMSQKMEETINTMNVVDDTKSTKLS
jgi:uncharacterized radical SAM superfamily protein